jgi:apolipoprotein D and lipocalin family protein
MRKSLKIYTVFIFVVGISMISMSCSTIPKDAKPIENFDASRYLGKSYEIARFDFRFERDINNTTAEYSINDDGSIKVVNSGYNYLKNKKVQAIGKAKFVKSSSIGELKVSFFGPFYGAYNIIMLDKEYKYALIAGKNLKYLWILSREKTIPDEIKELYINEAKRIGYKTENLIWVEQTNE